MINRHVKALLASDLVIVVLLVVLVFVIRWESRFPSVWEWDSVLFSQGVRKYDIGQHHPHPPGYPYYIGLGKLFRWLNPESDQALILMTIVFGAVTCIPFYFLFRRNSDRPKAILLVLLVQMSPLVWFTGERPMSDSVGLFWLYAGLVLFLPVTTNFSRLFWGLGVIGVAVGVRPQHLLILIPMIMYSMWVYLKSKQTRFFWTVLLSFVSINLVWSAIVIINISGISEFVRMCTSQTGNLVNTNSWFQVEQAFTTCGRLKRFLIDIWGNEALGYGMITSGLYGFYGELRATHRSEFFKLVFLFSPAFFFMLLFQDAYILRYMLPFVPLWVFFSVNGLCRLSKRVVGTEYWGIGICVGICLSCFVLMRETLQEIRANPLPQQTIVNLLSQELAQKSEGNVVIVTDLHFVPYLEYMLPEYKDRIHVIGDFSDTIESGNAQVDVYYLCEASPDIGLQVLASAEIRSNVFKTMSRLRFLKVCLIKNPVLLGSGWSHLGFDEKIKRYGRFVSKRCDFLLPGHSERNILEIEGGFRGDWTGPPPQMVLQFDKGPVYTYVIAERHFKLRHFVKGTDLSENGLHRVSLELMGPHTSIENQDSALFITTLQWLGNNE